MNGTQKLLSVLSNGLRIIISVAAWAAVAYAVFLIAPERALPVAEGLVGTLAFTSIGSIQKDNVWMTRLRKIAFIPAIIAIAVLVFGGPAGLVGPEAVQFVRSHHSLWIMVGAFVGPIIYYVSPLVYLTSLVAALRDSQSDGVKDCFCNYGSEVSLFLVDEFPNVYRVAGADESIGSMTFKPKDRFAAVIVALTPAFVESALAGALAWAGIHFALPALVAFAGIWFFFQIRLVCRFDNRSKGHCESKGYRDGRRSPLYRSEPL